MRSPFHLLLLPCLAVPGLASPRQELGPLPAEIFSAEFSDLVPTRWGSLFGHAPGELRRGLQSGKLPQPATPPQRAVYVHWETSAENDGISRRTSFWTEEQLARCPQLDVDARHLWRCEEQRFAVEYDVSAVCALGNDGLLVAGLDSEGVTVLEEWRLRWPERMPHPKPTGTGVRTAVAVVHPELDLVRRIPVDPNALRGGVHGLIELHVPHGMERAALVQLRGSYDLLRVELASGAHARVASALAPAAALEIAPPSEALEVNAQASALVIPALGNSSRRFTRAQRRHDGSVVYLLEETAWRCSRVARYSYYLALTDNEGDGLIDGHTLRRPCEDDGTRPAAPTR